MRKAMIEAVSDVIKNNEDSALLLVDIGVWAFRDVLNNYPERAKNIGIFEDGTVSLAAGLSLTGITPIIYGISPFIVQRALDQLKLDFVYQKLGGNFITTGASYDFSTLGYSHYCPEDVATLRLLPGMEVVAPGAPQEFSELFNQTWNDGNPTYFRMTDYPNNNSFKVEFGKANVIKKGKKATVITTAEMLDATIEAFEDLDVTILYYTTLAPFDCETLKQNYVGGKVIIVSPFYEGTLDAAVIGALRGQPVCIEEIAVPLEVLRNYGTKKDKDELLGLTSESIKDRIKSIL